MFSKIFPKIHAEGYKFLIIAGIITIVFYSFSDFLGLLGLILTIWVYYFFRDPERIIIENDNYLVSPADGEVIKVEEVDGPKELNLENQELKQGDRVGMIRFGSRADVYFENYEPLVKIGQKAISGETLLAKK